jgi:hypothetical protein
VVFAAFLQLQFGFVIFCRKNIGIKAARKNEIDYSVNLINILQAAIPSDLH